MPFTVEQVIEQARGEDARFTPESSPNKQVRRFLNRKHKRVRELTFETASEILLSTETISDPTADAFPDGYTFSAAWQNIYGGTVYFSGSGDRETPLSIVTYKQRHRPPATWPAYVKGDKLYLVGNKQDWRSVDHIDVDLVYATPELTEQSLEFDLPDRAKPVMVAFACQYMAKRSDEVGPEEYQAVFKADRQEEERDYLAWLSGRVGRAETATWREVW